MTILAVKKNQKNAREIQPNHTILLRKPSLLIQSANTILISEMHVFASKDADLYLFNALYLSLHKIGFIYHDWIFILIFQSNLKLRSSI